MLTVIKFARWLVQKAAAIILILVLALCVYGLWLYMRDNVDFELRRSSVIMALTGQRAHIQEALADVERRQAALAVEISQSADKIQKAGKSIHLLDELSSPWDLLFGNREQRATNAKRVEQLENLREAEQARLAQLKDAYQRAGWEKEGLEVALGRLDQQLVKVKQEQSRVAHYLRLAWNKIHIWVWTALGLYFLGPTAGKLVMYYLLAPLIMRGRPVRLTPGMAGMPVVSPSHVSLDLPLAADDGLWVREKFLQASDEGLHKRTRFMLDWRMPFTCLASGLVELIEMRPEPDTGGRHVTLSNQANPHVELVLITLAEGVSLVLRPSFLVGVLMAGRRRLTIRRRWQIFRWQAWVTMQFRFFEFAGPCRLVVAGSRGVRVESLLAREGVDLPARRTNQDATVGFTPNLDYKPVRAETFWSYYRGMNPLFDDLFAGRGLFLCQEVSTDGAAGQARRFWAGVWKGLLKVFGL